MAVGALRPEHALTVRVEGAWPAPPLLVGDARACRRCQLRRRQRTKAPVGRRRNGGIGRQRGRLPHQRFSAAGAALRGRGPAQCLAEGAATLGANTRGRQTGTNSRRSGMSLRTGVSRDHAASRVLRRGRSRHSGGMHQHAIRRLRDWRMHFPSRRVPSGHAAECGPRAPLSCHRAGLPLLEALRRCSVRKQELPDRRNVELVGLPACRNAWVLDHANVHHLGGRFGEGSKRIACRGRHVHVEDGGRLIGGYTE
mmetsp:Transcript_75506/g.218052  ORF Transcript_75506/g.218052 Transcript_75506/m.218052 type:complete len:254 (+) Transcript_75506:202-963(+)